MASLKHNSNKAIEFLHPRHAFTQAQASRLLSISPLAYSPSNPNESMREVNGAPCPSLVPNLLQVWAESE